MQKYNKNKNLAKRDLFHGHHIRAGAVAIALATGLHLSGSTHMGNRLERQFISSAEPQLGSHITERENETGRHVVRFDEGLRLPTTSGGNTA